MKTLKVSDALLRQIIIALEARKRELNNRFPEPVSEALTETCAALELAYSLNDQPFKA